MNCFQFVIWRSLTHLYLDILFCKSVVNCFQFVIWRSLTHPGSLPGASVPGCELLSICDLTIFDTPQRGIEIRWLQLWIAFNLWFDDLWHTNTVVIFHWSGVVNCFQFVIWRSLTHHCIIIKNIILCCELLSICDLTIFDTPTRAAADNDYQLWIAFNLWFDDLWHT